MSMARTQANMNARSTSTSDWVDYALDQKTVADPNTGQVSKVSNSYTHTWVDSTGTVSYQTNDPNANPNGVLQGNWTEQQQVHGNGTPY
jgi:predicted double-glycine peptidase